MNSITYTTPNDEIGPIILDSSIAHIKRKIKSNFQVEFIENNIFEWKITKNGIQDGEIWYEVHCGGIIQNRYIATCFCLKLIDSVLVTVTPIKILDWHSDHPYLTKKIV